MGAEAALAELAEAQQQVAQAEEKMKAFKELARKLEEVRWLWGEQHDIVSGVRCDIAS